MSDTGQTAEFNEVVKPEPVKSLKKRQPIRRTPFKVGRNNPCACGSGKKFKDCHYNEVQTVNLIPIGVA